MAIRVRGKKFQVDVTYKGRRSRFTADTREQAVIEEAKAMAALKEGRDYVPTSASPKARSGTTLGEAFDRVWKMHWEQQRDSKGTYINAQTLLGVLGHSTDVKDITGEKVAKLRLALIDKGLAASTQNKIFSILRVILKHCVEWGMIDNYPKIPHLKTHSGRLRYIHSLEEEQKVLSYWSDRGEPVYSLLWAFLIDTGFRISEALQVDAKEHLKGDILSTRHDTKSGRYRSVKATSRVLDVFAKLGPRPFEGITYDMARQKWDEMKAGLGLEDDNEFVIHCLRHTCASRLVQAGVPLVIVQKWLGHSTIQTTLRYSHLAPDSLEVAHKALENWGRDGSDMRCDVGDVAPSQVTLG